jgi:hypothetical protein
MINIGRRKIENVTQKMKNITDFIFSNKKEN